VSKWKGEIESSEELQLRNWVYDAPQSFSISVFESLAAKKYAPEPRMLQVEISDRRRLRLKWIVMLGRGAGTVASNVEVVGLKIFGRKMLYFMRSKGVEAAIEL
jgi:hypothetical protein